MNPESGLGGAGVVFGGAVVVEGAEQYYRLFSAEELVELAVEGIERRGDEDDAAEESPRADAQRSISTD